MKKSELKALIREVVEESWRETNKSLFSKKEGMPYNVFVKKYRDEIDDAVEEYYDLTGVRDKSAAMAYAIGVVSKSAGVRVRATPDFSSTYIPKPDAPVKLDAPERDEPYTSTERMRTKLGL